MSTKLDRDSTTVRRTSVPGPGSAGEEAAEQWSDSPERPFRGAAPPDATPGVTRPPPAPTLAVHRLHQAVGDGVAEGHDLVIVQHAE